MASSLDCFKMRFKKVMEDKLVNSYDDLIGVLYSEIALLNTSC